MNEFIDHCKSFLLERMHPVPSRICRHDAFRIGNLHHLPSNLVFQNLKLTCSYLLPEARKKAFKGHVIAAKTSWKLQKSLKASCFVSFPFAILSYCFSLNESALRHQAQNLTLHGKLREDLFLRRRSFESSSAQHQYEEDSNKTFLSFERLCCVEVNVY